ncbi:ATP-binding protein [Paenibacillus sp. P36]|uniref:ATP-binding protein n=1 Tax=Paenibacillus sp. P36 TaxID=3342538 RepID=UPI0038B3CC64
MYNLIFIGGIHGVGKTSLCKLLSKEYNIPSYSASKLISDAKNIEFADNKRVKDIDNNQEILIRALNQIDINSKFILLEGHFCLINEFGQITRIPKQTFYNLYPKAFILLKESVEEISTRLRNRDAQLFNKSFLESFQEEEIAYAKEVSQSLQIPCIIHSKESSMESLMSFFDNIVT